MNKLSILGVALACTTLVTGCGNPHEKMVKEVCAAVQSGDRHKADEFWEKNVDSIFKEIVERRSEKENSKAFKKAFGAIAKSKEPVETKVIKTFEENGTVMASAIEAKCADTTLYFLVGKQGKDKPDKILGITSDKEEALAGGR